MRLPGIPWHDRFPFLHDTGCCMMLINDIDVLALRGPLGIPPGLLQPAPPIVGFVPMIGVVGAPMMVAVIEVEVCILDVNNCRLTAWHRVQTSVLPPGLPAGPRYDGPFGRYSLFNAFKPDNNYQFTMSTTKNGLNLPTLNLAAAPPVIDPIVPGTAASAPAVEVPPGIGFMVPLPPRAANTVAL